jgi:hypothetical protein
MGSKEYSFTRPKDPQPEFDKLLTTYIPQLEKILEKNGVAGPERVKGVVEAGAGHTESAWARRLPEALEFLLTPWWRTIAAGKEHYLYFSSPKRPQGGKPAAMFFNRAKSDPLRHTGGKPHLSIGFNEWRAPGTQDVEMAPAPYLGLPGDWWVAPFKVEATAYEANFAFSDGKELWDNNDGNNFYMKLRSLNLVDLSRSSSPQLPVEKLAEYNRDNLYFTFPSHLVAGGPVQASDDHLLAKWQFDYLK